MPLRERFEELAGPPLPPPTAPLEDGEDPSAAASAATAGTGAAGAGAAAAGGPRQGQAKEEERFVLFDNWSQLGGPRGGQVAARLYGVLDANGDGRLDFQVRSPFFVRHVVTVLLFFVRFFFLYLIKSYLNPLHYLILQKNTVH